jgi:hydroxymethylbilane synthase
MTRGTIEQPRGSADRPLRLGTRRSPLALTQATHVADALRARGHIVDLVEVVTEGDRSADSLTAIGGTGVFAAELRERLRSGGVDLAVHSYKDLPTKDDGSEVQLTIAAVPRREDPRDALCCPAGHTLLELPSGARIGTGSPRRAAQLLALGTGLQVVPIRGNVDTRLKKAVDGEVDAVVLARAGLARLDRLDAITETLDPLLMLPAPAQGALAVECRADDAEVTALLAEALDDPDTRAAVGAERSLLEALEAGCSSPIGALAEVVEGEPTDDGPGANEIFLRAVVAAPDGSDVLRRSATGPAAVGRALAAEMLADGAGEMMNTSTEVPFAGLTNAPSLIED